jgi:hypothetical protein
MRPTRIAKSLNGKKFFGLSMTQGIIWVNTAGQMIIHGVDGAFGWQLTIHDESEAASIATVDTALSGFGSCTNKQHSSAEV